jgi:hypothetical protein
MVFEVALQQQLECCTFTQLHLADRFGPNKSFSGRLQRERLLAPTLLHAHRPVALWLQMANGTAALVKQLGYLQTAVYS